MNIRPIVACAYHGMFIEQLTGNALTCHNTIVSDSVTSRSMYDHISCKNFRLCNKTCRLNPFSAEILIIVELGDGTTGLTSLF
jgi:hypothetical protein